MGPRIESTSQGGSPSSVLFETTSPMNKGDDCHTIIPTTTSTAQVHQRRKDFAMQESTSSFLSSSAYLVESSSGETNASHQSRSSDNRILLVSESQSSLVDNGPSTTIFPSSFKQSPSPMLLEWRPRLILAWSLHFVSCIIVLWYGSAASHGERKYIPIDVTKVEDECSKGFIDVFSSSIDDPGAFVCCRSTSGDTSINNPHICNPPPSYLPFARRLARFPDAWLLPLFPLLVRGGWQIYCNYAGKASLSKLDSLHAKRRLYLYLSLIQIRGWILYLAFDELEDFFVRSGGIQCWYEEYLHPNFHHCQGRMTDFSDHVVLYFAQILPIALMEILYAFSIPYWSQHHGGGRGSRKISSGFDIKGQQHLLVPIILVLWMTNLYIVTFLGAYKTAAYFHTGPEVFVGFLVSMLVQLPLCLLQCTSAFPVQREYFFGSIPL